MQQEGRLTAIAIAATACTVESPGELSKVVVPAVHGDLCEQDADCDIDSLASQLIKDLRVAHGPGNAETTTFDNSPGAATDRLARYLKLRLVRE